MATLITTLAGRAALGAYAAASWIVAPALDLHLRRRAAQGKEDPLRLNERLGAPAQPRPPGALVWVHAASVGEALSLLPILLVIEQRWPSLHVLMTSGTPTSAAALANRLPPRVLHQFAPIDTPGAVSGFIEHWRPDAALWVESELWPNMLGALKRRRIPAILVNGRMSDRSFRRWRRLRPVARAVLDAFVAILAQSEEDARRFIALGARAASPAGNLKLAAADLPAEGAALTAARALLGDRPRWLSASTHPGEEQIAAEVHLAVAARKQSLLTVIVPRHPARGGEIAAMLRGRGLSVAVRSRNEPVAVTSQVYVADTIGELGVWYRLCPISFVGGSLVPHGGHNPLEPARLGCAVLTGPHVDNFRSLTDGLAAAGALTIVGDAPGLARQVGGLLDDPAGLAALGAAARRYADRHAEVLPQLTAALAPWLDKIATGART